MKKFLIQLCYYLISYAAIEFILATIFVLAMLENDPSVWAYFGWVQVGVPIVAFVGLAFINVFIDAEKEKEKEQEWYSKVNKMLKEWEKKENKK